MVNLNKEKEQLLLRAIKKATRMTGWKYRGCEYSLHKFEASAHIYFMVNECNPYEVLCNMYFDVREYTDTLKVFYDNL